MVNAISPPASSTSSDFRYSLGGNKSLISILVFLFCGY
jgi:hypothetical protein